MGRAVIAALLASALLCGCDLLAGFAPGVAVEAGRGGGRDALADSARPFDGATDIDGGDAEPDVPAADTDAAIPCLVNGMCVECDALSSPITVCPSCPQGGGDCDSLDDARDPWVGRCNALLFSEDFFDLQLTGWSKLHAWPTMNVSPCGLLHFATPDQTTADIFHDSQVSTPYLAEVAFRPASNGRWVFSVELDGDELLKSQMRVCSVEYDGVRYQLVARIAAFDGAGLLRGPAVALPGPPGGLERLQSFVEKSTLYCRWFGAAGQVRQTSMALALYDLRPTGGIVLEHVRRQNSAPVDLRVDYVRLFAN